MFCDKCKEIYSDKNAKYCSMCGNEVIKPIRVIERPYFIEAKEKIVQLVELHDLSRQIHIFTGDGFRPITKEDDVSWKDLENAEIVPLDVFFSLLIGDPE